MSVPGIPASPETSPTPDSLRRVIGTLGLAAGIINITIGGGIFRLPGSVAGSLGPAAPLAYLVCAAAMGLIVWCMADAGRRVARTGGPYAYVGMAFGPYAGFISGVLLWMLGTFATAAVTTVLASSLGGLVPFVAGPAAQHAVIIGAILIWSLVNLRGAVAGVRLNSIVTIAKLAPLLLLVMGGAFFVDTGNLRITEWPAAETLARTSLLLIFAFAGIEVALVPSGEVRDTARTVPRAIALAMIGVTTLYVALQVVTQGILGSALALATVSPLADAAGASLGGWARSVLLAGAAVSMFGYLGGAMLSMPRMVFALARDGFLPRVLGGLHPGTGAPRAAIVAQGIVTVVLAITGTFERLAIFANVSALTLYLGCALASWRLRGMERSDRPTGGGVVSRVMPWLACVVIVWLLTSLTRGEWLGFGACVAAASLVYVVVRRR